MGTETVRGGLSAELESFAHDGVRKAALLTPYGRLLRSWATAVHREDTTESREPTDEIKR